MPYIKSDLRPKFDPHIKKLAKAITQAVDELGDEKEVIGILNYCVTRLALLSTPAYKYWAFAAIRAALNDAQQEYYRRVVAPYEDKKAEENGDVYS